MKTYSMDAIRNIAVMGHGKCGKTTLTEAMLFNAKMTDRMGKVADGNTVTDYDGEEIKRQFSISTALATVEWKDMKYNMIDTPGFFDFVGDVKEGIRAADSALIALSGRSGVSVGTENVFRYAKQRGVPIMFFVNKIDDDRADYQKTLEEMKEKFGKSVTPFVYPIREGDEFKGFVDIVDMTARRYEGQDRVDIPVPDGMAEIVAPLREMIMEAVAETDEALMVKYFNGEEFTFDEIKQAIRKGVKDGVIYPVYCGSGQDNIGVRSLMDGMGKYLPAPSEIEEIARVADTGEPVELVQSETETTAAVVFKTIADPYVGKMSLFRVYSGEVKGDSTLYNPNKDVNEKIGKVFNLCGKKQLDAKSIKAGDIGAVAKLESTKTGDTLCDPAHPIILESMEFPEPVIDIAIEPKDKANSEKMGIALAKLAEEDPTFKTWTDQESGQTIIAGMGELHLDIIVDRLKREFKVECSVGKPQVSYKETIRNKVKVQGKFIRQSGGRGQYGDVWLEMEPLEAGKGIEFESKIVGGVVPKEYIKPIEEGVREAAQSGVLAGYPVIDFKATLVDGSYHEVDSSEMAFKIAGSMAFKEGCKQAKSVILEPIMKVEVTVPEEYMGDVIGDINSRRGRLEGMEAIQGNQVIRCFIPLSEMFGYATDLRSKTQGRGTYSMEPSHYEEVPKSVFDNIVASRAKKQN